MSDNNSSTRTTIIVAAIGGIATLLAAVLPVIIPILFPPATPTASPLQISPSYTPEPSHTVAPEVPTPTFTVTDTPVLTYTPTATFTETPTDIPTFTPTFTLTPVPTSPLNAFIGTWTNTEKNPVANNVISVLTRLVISKTGDTFSFQACRKMSGGEVYLDAQSVMISFDNNTLAMYPFLVSSKIRWSIKAKLLSSKTLSATVEESTISLLFTGADTFQLEKQTRIGGQIFLACQAYELAP